MTFADVWQGLKDLMSGRIEHEILELQRQILHELSLLYRVSETELEFLQKILQRLPPPTLLSFEIQQLDPGGNPLPITGIKAGSTGTFVETPLPAGAVLPPGTIPQWTSSEHDAVATPSTDGTQCSVAVVAGTTITTFNLTCAAPTVTGSPSGTVAVPVLPGTPLVTGFQIDQTS